MRGPPMAGASEPQNESNQCAIRLKGACRDAPNLLGDHEERGGDTIRKAATPGPFLKFHASGIVPGRFEGAEQGAVRLSLRSHEVGEGR